MTSFTPKEIWRNRKSGLWTGTVTSIRSGWSDDCCCFSSGSYGLEQFSDLQCEGRCTLKCPFQLQNQFLPFSLSVGSLVYIYGWNNCISFTRGRPADAVICSSAHPPLLSFPEQPCQCLTLIDTLSKNCLLFLLPYFFADYRLLCAFPYSDPEPYLCHLFNPHLIDLALFLTQTHHVKYAGITEGISC